MASLENSLSKQEVLGAEIGCNAEGAKYVKRDDNRFQVVFEGADKKIKKANFEDLGKDGVRVNLSPWDEVVAPGETNHYWLGGLEANRIGVTGTKEGVKFNGKKVE